jgi:putative flippase GtrA
VKFVLLYAMSLVLNVALNSSFLFILKEYSYIFDFPFKYFIAFIGATGFSSIFNFLGQKFWVFADKTPEELEEDEVES